MTPEIEQAMQAVVGALILGYASGLGLGVFVLAARRGGR